LELFGSLLFVQDTKYVTLAFFSNIKLRIISMTSYDISSRVDISISKTPSLAYNNLTCNGTTVAFAHKTEVITFSETTGTGKSSVKETTLKPRLPESKVIQVKWCHIGGRDYLVVGSGAGLAVYDESVSSSVFVMELASQDVPIQDPEAAFVRGITAVPSTSHICAGSSTGHIFVLSVNGESIELDTTIKPHADDENAATSAMACSKSWVVAASDSGSVQIFDATNDFQLSARFPGTAPCTSVCTTGDVLVAGYTTGHLRLYRLSTKVIFAEIGAHTRAVTAIDAHPELSQFVSVGEDSIINVWQIATVDESKGGEDPLVSVLFTATSADSLLTGVAFSRNGTSNLLTTSYDQKRVRIFTPHR
jgi:hypothetical protein